MSIESSHDPRRALVREKYFSLHPRPLERWLWQQGLPQAAERVFWLHWEEGMKRGDWCSELSLREVARECCIDPSTVTRAYQVLKNLGLIRREDPGRDPNNPFQQAIAITEVRLPRALLVELGRAPDRPRRDPGRPQSASERPAAVVAPEQGTEASTAIAPRAADPGPEVRLDRARSAALLRKLSDRERSEFFLASRDRRSAMTFDEPTALSPEERGWVLEILARISTARPEAARAASRPVALAVDLTKPRRVSALEAARLRRQIAQLVGTDAAVALFREVLWSVEEGALRRFETPLAVNIALKKIREGLWRRPNRMPPQWLRATTRAETCTAA